MIDLAEARIVSTGTEYRDMELKYKGFVIKYQTYSEYKGGIDYKESADYKTRREWWIFNIKIKFMDKKLHKEWWIDGGYKLNNVEKIINDKACVFIDQLYKEFL